MVKKKKEKKIPEKNLKKRATNLLIPVGF